MKKVLFIFSGVFALLFGFFYFVFPSLFLPQTKGQVKIKGLQAKVRVVRDSYGVPHIEAQNKRDLFRALGYTMAQDRLFQMDITRRTINGELSEIFGEKTLKFDKLSRALKIRKTADRNWERFKQHYDPAVFETAQAFVEGIQAFIGEDKLPLEFTLLNYKPRPFSIPEMMGVTGYMALSFAEPIETDPLYSELSEKISPEMLNQLRLSDKPFPKKSSPLKVSLHDALSELQDYLPLFHGSNAWAVSGTHTVSGLPLVANDPHIGFSNPSVWYEAYLSSPDYELYGYFLPLVPFPAMGQTQNSVWTVTMSEVDDIDLYVESFDTQNSKRYLYKGQWQDLKEETEVIKVKGGKDLSFVTGETLHGPLVDNTFLEVKGKRVALKWTYHHPDNDALRAFFLIPFAKSPKEFEQALSYAAGPGLNMIWASTKGDLVQWVMGKIPRRPKNLSSDRLLDGASGKEEYLGYLSIDENPHQINPPSGKIVTTNWRPDGEHDINGFWQPVERYKRAHEFLMKDKKWGPADFQSMQMDSKLQSAPQILSSLLRSVKAENKKEAEALDYLKNWDGNSSQGSVGSTIFHVWTQYNLKEILEPELGEEGLRRFCHSACWHFYKKVLEDEKSPWWKGEKDKVLGRGFKRAMSFLEEKLGGNVISWEWGKLHTITYEHPLGKVKWLAPLFNLGPYAAHGTSNVLNAMIYSKAKEAYTVHAGPSTRRVIDLSQMDRTWSVLPTGNSGNLFSPHYGDQVKLHIEGKQREVVFKKPVGPLEILELQP